MDYALSDNERLGYIAWDEVRGSVHLCETSQAT